MWQYPCVPFDFEKIVDKSGICFHKEACPSVFDLKEEGVAQIFPICSASLNEKTWLLFLNSQPPLYLLGLVKLAAHIWKYDLINREISLKFDQQECIPESEVGQYIEKYWKTNILVISILILKNAISKYWYRYWNLPFIYIATNIDIEKIWILILELILIFKKSYQYL